MKQVLITGGTGFIGSHVVSAFCQRNDVQVICLVRMHSDLSFLQTLPVSFRYAALEDQAAVAEALRGIDFVVHVAGYARDWGKYADFYRTNVLGTQNILEACTANNINNLIITASNSVYGEESFSGIKDESSPQQSHYRYFADGIFLSMFNYYRDTKAEAKRLALEYAKQYGLNLTVIEPIWVYGEREFNTGFYEYVKTAKSGVPFLPGSTRNKFHVVYAGELARAYVLAYEKMLVEQSLQGVNVFLIGDRKAEKMERIYQVFCCEAGCRKPRNLPKWLVYPVGFLLELVYTLAGAKNPPLLTRGRVNMFYDNIEYSTRRAEEVLGFKSRVSLEEGIRRTVQWYRERGLL